MSGDRKRFTHDAPPETFGGEGEGSNDEQRCPECGAAMIEFERRSEGDATYVWYRCNVDGCDGQWLARTGER
jgi:hypothetical protein